MLILKMEPNELDITCTYLSLCGGGLQDKTHTLPQPVASACRQLCRHIRGGQGGDFFVCGVSVVVQAGGLVYNDFFK